jgi:hypothetical protein
MNTPLTCRLVNLTPHTIHLLTANGSPIAEIPATPQPARCAEHTTRTGWLQVNHHPVPLLQTAYGAVTGLPEPQPDTWYLVSRPVADATPERDDLLVTADILRSQDGIAIGCRALTRATTPRGVS